MYVFSGLWRKNARVFNVLLSLTKFEKPKVPCCHFTKPKKLEFAFQRCFGRSECFEITKTYKKPYFEIPNHSQIPHQTHLSPQLMRYGKLPRLNRFRFRVPLHSSYVKGDQRFAAIHQHKLPDLQRQKQHVTFDDIQNVEDLRSSATWRCSFCICFTVLVRFGSLLNTTNNTLLLASSNRKLFQVAICKKKKKCPPLIHLFGGHLLTFSSLT